MIGKKLEHLLKMRNKSRKEMAEVLNISTRTVDKIFTGERDLKTEEINTLGNWLQVNTSTFLDDSITNIFDNKDSHIQNQGTNYTTADEKIIEAKNETIATLKDEISLLKDTISTKDKRITELEKQISRQRVN
jgi:transcriptional regulator with XRE-family HTH domain